MRRIHSWKTDLHLREVLRGASVAVSIRLAGTLLGFAVSVMVARLLGADGAGLYFLTLSIITISATLGRLGFDNTVVRFIASYATVNEWHNLQLTYRSVVRIVFVLSFTLSVLLFCSAPYLAEQIFQQAELRGPLMLGALAVMPVSLSLIHAEALRGLRCIPASQLIKTVFISLITLVLLYPFIMYWQITGAVAAYVVATIIAGCAAWFLWRRSYAARHCGGTAESPFDLKQLFRSSWPLFGVAVTALVIQQSATILLGAWGTTADVGIFNIANRIASLLLFPLMAFISILAPKFAAMHRDGAYDDLVKLARRSSLLLSVFAMIGSFCVFISSEWILSQFGPIFADNSLILEILLVGVAINVATGPGGTLLVMAGFEQEVMRVTVLSALFMIGLCAVFIPAYGVVGAAITVSFVGVVQNLHLTYMVRKKMGFWLFGGMLGGN